MLSRCIAFVSPLGGTAQTTLLTAVADVWTEEGRACLAVELTAQNRLALHCGLEQPPAAGWVQCVADGQWWGDAALQNAAGLRFLPYGSVSAPTGLPAVVLQPDWLQQQLQSLALPQDGCVLLDAPAWPAPLAQQALQCAELVVICLDVAPRAVEARATLLAMLAQLRPGSRAVMVLTRYSPRRAAQIQSRQILRAQWPELKSPYVLHDDESVPLAQLQGLSVTRWAPKSQAAHDLQGIAHWLQGRLAAPQETTE